MEKITLLVANYNCAAYVQECLASVKEQTSDRWLCIVCDDASTDDSIGAIEPLLDDRISLIRNEQNLGYTRTLIKMVAHATTDIVGILDADDGLSREELARLTLMPGFSTRAQPTGLSGRGIGLDAVNQEITALGGSMGLLSEPGQGCEVLLRVPLASDPR